MQTGLALGLVLWPGLGLADDKTQPALDRFIDFQHHRYGVPPTEFDYEATGPLGAVTLGGRPAWRTSVDLFAPSPKFVLIQASARARVDHFPIALLRDSTLETPVLAVSFKLVNAEAAAGVGLLWRAQSKDDYEAVLVSGAAGGWEARVLRMKHGQPVWLARAPVGFTAAEWCSLEVSALPNRTTVWLDGRQVLGAPAPSSIRPGRVGLITWSDTVACFDDFHVQAGRERVARRVAAKPEPSTSPTLHVAEIVTTAADFKTRQELFGLTGRIYWQVRVGNGRSEPVPGAMVRCELARSSGRVFGQEQAMAGTDGVAWFSHGLPAGTEPGPCFVRVTSVTHASETEATYAPSANQSSATFVLQPSNLNLERSLRNLSNKVDQAEPR